MKNFFLNHKIKESLQTDHSIFQDSNAVICEGVTFRNLYDKANIKTI